MRRMLPVLMALLAIPAVAQAGEVIEVLSEDFESGLDAWTTGRTPYVDDYPDRMNVFDGSGAVISSDPRDQNMFGPMSDDWGVWGNSQCVGQSSKTWDGTSDHWIQKQWPGALAPGTYSVTLEYDFYVYADPATLCGGRWEVGNRVYLLTDEDFDYPCFNFDNHENLEAPGFKVDYWPGYENYATCQDVGGELRCVGPASGSGEQPCTVTTDCQNAGATPTAWIYNGKWRRVTWEATVTTTTGNLELRLLKHEKCSGLETVAWDDVDLVIRDASEQVVFEFHDNFDGPDPLADWTQVISCREPVSNNDEPKLFAANDPLLYKNIDNPGSQSAGYSSAEYFKDKTGHAWMKRLFPNALPPGTSGTMRLEFDWYVYRRLQNDGVDNDSPTVFPAPDGAGIYGPNTGYPGSVSVGYASNLIRDGIRYAWIQKQFPSALPAGTYDVTWEMDLYVYSIKTGDYAHGNRLYLLTDTAYNNPTWNPDGSMPANSGGSFRVSYWNKAPGQTVVNGQWAHVVISRTGATAFATASGNLEIRLLADDKEGGAQTVAWDNLSITVTDPNQGNAVVWTYSDDFESGLAGWTQMVRPNDSHDWQDPWWLGNKVYVFTDDLYDQNNPDIFYNAQFQVARWPGDNDSDGTPEPEQPWNGIWWRKVIERPFTTTTGNIDVRLLTRQKYAGKDSLEGYAPEVAAWDNVKLSFILPCNPVRFDADDDGDVDQADFAVLQACYTGADDPDEIFNAEACRCVNSDGDSDIDAEDVAAFEACASGPGVLANVNCDNALSPP
ncbi:MAG TPA: hypothetical protein PLL20_05040 [Phycisphaerae bacterium]|nr:hypothetical protein [Phycisphaerae bacterium]